MRRRGVGGSHQDQPPAVGRRRLACRLGVVAGRLGTMGLWRRLLRPPCLSRPIRSSGVVRSPYLRCLVQLFGRGGGGWGWGPLLGCSRAGAERAFAGGWGGVKRGRLEGGNDAWRTPQACTRRRMLIHQTMSVACVGAAAPLDATPIARVFALLSLKQFGPGNAFVVK
jgi:hypothetical protein